MYDSLYPDNLLAIKKAVHRFEIKVVSHNRFKYGCWDLGWYWIELCLKGAFLIQGRQVLLVTAMFFVIPGQNTVDWSVNNIAVLPWWAAWIQSKTLGQRSGEVSTLSSFSMTLSRTYKPPKKIVEFGMLTVSLWYVRKQSILHRPKFIILTMICFLETFPR